MNYILWSSCSKMYGPGIQYTCTFEDYYFFSSLALCLIRVPLLLLFFLLPGSDEEMDKLAEEEEEEALALQKHMAACLEEQDFDTAEFEVRLSWSYTSHRHIRSVDHN